MIRTPHMVIDENDIAKTVLMPGDPLRAKFIAENFLTDAKLINDVRGMLGYTGYYNGKKITVMASGMGMPSMGIYCYELYKFCNVENIIRIGSCGGYLKSLKLFDVILAENVYNEGNFALTFNNEDCHVVSADSKLNNKIKEVAKEANIPLVVGNTACTECFDLYMSDVNAYLNRIPSDLNIIAAEMEAFALFYVAKTLNKKASCLMSVVDIKDNPIAASKEEREKSLVNMIKLALLTATKDE